MRGSRKGEDWRHEGQEGETTRSRDPFTKQARFKEKRVTTDH